MARRRGNTSNERLLCWEQIDRTNRLFRVSHTFAPREFAPKLLPLYALFSVVEEACSRFSDEQLARSKLAWWRQEILGRAPDRGSHPVIRELTRNVDLDTGWAQPVERMLNDAESRLDEPSPAGLEELRRRCVALSRPQVELEMRLCGIDEPAATAFPATYAAGQGARSGLSQLLRESLRAPEASAFWWLPLDMLARHGVSRAEVRRAPGSGPARALFGELLGSCRDWGDTDGPPPAPAAGPAGAMDHLWVHGRLQSRLLERLRRSTPDRFSAEVKRTTLGDLFHAWKSARRVSRP